MRRPHSDFLGPNTDFKVRLKWSFGRFAYTYFHQTAMVAQSFSEKKAIIFPIDLIGRSSSFVCCFVFFVLTKAMSGWEQ